jgi:hypothetical protein
MPASKPGFLNNKQELFCRFVARGETYTKSYELAGYAPSTSNASNLANRPDIKHRIEELKKEFIEEQALHEAALERARALDAENGDPLLPATRQQGEWTVHRVMDMIAENVRLAQIAQSFGAANDALKMLGEAMGMFHAAKNQTPPASPLAFIGKVINQLPSGEEEAPAAPMKSANPLAPPADEAE